jgi:hypothetical protein
MRSPSRRKGLRITARAPAGPCAVRYPCRAGKTTRPQEVSDERIPGTHLRVSAGWWRRISPVLDPRQRCDLLSGGRGIRQKTGHHSQAHVVPEPMAERNGRALRRRCTSGASGPRRRVQRGPLETLCCASTSPTTTRRESTPRSAMRPPAGRSSIGLHPTPRWLLCRALVASTIATAGETRLDQSRGDRWPDTRSDRMNIDNALALKLGVPASVGACTTQLSARSVTCATSRAAGA